MTARELLSRLRASYWFVPLVITVLGVVLAVALLRADAAGNGVFLGTFADILPNSPEGARALLSAIIASMITAISVTFSVTIVALTVAAQHFGPRVLNNFVRHTAPQVVLGTFIATFMYAVLTLGAIRGSGEDARVPALTTAGAVGLVILAVGALIYYVHHVATSLQVGELAAEIAADFGQALRRESDDAADGAEEEEIPEPPTDAAVVPSLESGYVQRIDYDALVRAAVARGARLWIDREPGAFALAGAPLVVVAPAAACDDELAAAVRRACITGRDRTLWHDPEFAVKQLVEIALRALSPGVNEPFTALTCIDALTQGLAAALAAPLPRAVWRDERGEARVFTAPQSFPTLLRSAFDPIRLFAGPNPAIYARLADAAAQLLAVATRPGDARELSDYLERVAHKAAATVPDEYDRLFVDVHVQLARRQFDGRINGTRMAGRWS